MMYPHIPDSKHNEWERIENLKKTFSVRMKAITEKFNEKEKKIKNRDSSLF